MFRICQATQTQTTTNWPFKAIDHISDTIKACSVDSRIPHHYDMVRAVLLREILVWTVFREFIEAQQLQLVHFIEMREWTIFLQCIKPTWNMRGAYGKWEERNFSRLKTIATRQSKWAQTLHFINSNSFIFNRWALNTHANLIFDG